jgi:hypothetical protein
MKKRDKKQRNTARNKFDRAMVDSTDLLAGYLDEVRYPIDAEDFLLFELGRLIDEGTPSFMNDEFRFLVEQSIRITLNPDIDLRARLVERLRREYPHMPSRARKIAPQIIGAIEDSDFSLDRIGAVVRSYTNQMLEVLENTEPDNSGADRARTAIESWREGTLDRFGLFAAIEEGGAEAVPAVADLLLEALGEPETVQTSLELLCLTPCPLAARVIAYVVSEPILEEAQEERAREILGELWPLPRTYILYRLKQHLHEDVPFRWLQILIELGEERAVDRILEELVTHARDENYVEDLRAILDLLDRSRDPGVVGKLLQLLTEETAPEAPLDLLEEWLEHSSLSAEIEAALERWNQGEIIIVPAGEDFNTFATSQPDRGLDDLRRTWNLAYHEVLGWQQRSRFDRGPVEEEFENDLEEAMMRELALNPGLDEDSLRAQIELFREDWLVTRRDNVVPLIAIYLERPRNNVWSDAIYRREINGWYIRAAECFDSGDRAGCRQLLDILLEIEPEYPLARVLDGLTAGNPA